MIFRRFVQVSALLSIGSCLCITAPSAVALPSVETAAKESKQEPESQSVRQGLPGRRISGGSRTEGIFLDENEHLAALTAPDAVSITTSEYPEILLYLPEMKVDNSAEFVLLDSEGKVVYEETFVADRQAKLMSVGVVANAEGRSLLSLNKDYEWYFSIIPDAQDRANDAVVHGSIRRVDEGAWLSQQQVDTQLGAQMAAAEPLIQAQMMYQEANLWHDAALLLNELRQAHPESKAIASEWNQLLEVAGLSNIADSPTQG